MVAKKKEKKNDSSNLKELDLPDVLDIRCANEFFEDIKTISNAGTNLVINAEKLEKITTPAIQILLASCAAVCKKSGSFKIKNASSEMESVFITLGLESQFNEWK